MRLVLAFMKFRQHKKKKKKEKKNNFTSKLEKQSGLIVS